MSVVSTGCKGGFFLLLIVIISHLDRKDLKKVIASSELFLLSSSRDGNFIISFHFIFKRKNIVL